MFGKTAKILRGKYYSNLPHEGTKRKQSGSAARPRGLVGRFSTMPRFFALEPVGMLVFDRFTVFHGSGSLFGGSSSRLALVAGSYVRSAS